MINVIDEYIVFFRKMIITYNKKILSNYYNDEISSYLLNSFISIMFLNYDRDYKEESKPNINKCMEAKIAHLKALKKYKDEDIKNNEQAIKYSMHLSINSWNDKLVEDSNRFRINKLKINDSKYISDMKELYLSFDKRKESYLTAFDTHDFDLDYKLTNIKNLYDTNITYNIVFPQLYSDISIEKAFDKDIISEQKLFVYYTLLSIKVLKDVLSRIYTNKYIISFSTSVFEKSKKTKRLLNIINNDVMKDKVSLKITYREYIENKDSVVELIQSGYKFACIIDESFIMDRENLIKLNIFEFIIINNKEYLYNGFKKMKNIVIMYKEDR